MTKPGGFIYAISATGTPLVKIGWASRSVEQRCKTLQTGQPYPLAILAAIPVEAYGERIEHRIHTFLEEEHQRGEWFISSMDIPTLEALVTRAMQHILAEEKDKGAKRLMKWTRRLPLESEEGYSLGWRLQQARARKGWSQAELARYAALDSMHISKLERGVTTEIWGSTLRALCRTLDVSADYMLGLIDEERSYAKKGR